MGLISPRVRFDVLSASGFKCVYCGRSAEDARIEVDHVRPKSGGGSNDRENLVAACFDCNRGKRDSVIGDTPTVAVIRSAREKDAQLHAELYCRNSGCATRETLVYFKDYDNEVVKTLIQKGGVFKCVLCRKPLVVHWVMGSREYRAYDERNARLSVNMQIESIKNNGVVCLGRVDDSLPGLETAVTQ